MIISSIRRMGHTLLIHFSWRTGLGRFITFSQSSVLVSPAFSTCVTSCHLFHSRVFHPYHLVPRFPLPRFPPVSLRATFSTPAFSTHVISCRVFHSCVFLPCIFDGATFSTPAFSVAPLGLCTAWTQYIVNSIKCNQSFINIIKNTLKTGCT